MSTDIKPGQTWKDRHSDDFLHVDKVGTELVTYTWDSGRTYTRTWDEFLSGFEPTTPAPSLPTQASDDDGRETAPLDRAALRDALTDVDVLKRDAASGISYIDPDLAVERLADLLGMPAVEPEPEWPVGQLADITNGHRWERVVRFDTGPDGHVWQTIPDSSWWNDAAVTEVRPLVVIDPATVDVESLVTTFVEAIRESQHGGPVDGIRAILSNLGLDGAR